MINMNLHSIIRILNIVQESEVGSLAKSFAYEIRFAVVTNSREQ